jgi:hypothetical protein
MALIEVAKGIWIAPEDVRSLHPIDEVHGVQCTFKDGGDLQLAVSSAYSVSKAAELIAAQINVALAAGGGQ